MSTVKRFAVINRQVVEHPQGCFALYEQVQKDHARALRAETALVNLLCVIEGTAETGCTIDGEHYDRVLDAQRVLERTQE